MESKRMAKKRSSLYEFNDENVNCSTSSDDEEDNEDFGEHSQAYKRRMIDSDSSSPTTSPIKYHKTHWFLKEKKDLVPIVTSPSLSTSSSRDEEDIEYEEEDESGFGEDSSNGSKGESPRKVLTRIPINISQIEFSHFHFHARQKLQKAEDKISCLPDEMILRILKLLPQKALGRMALMSRQFRRLTADESLWKRMDLMGKFVSAESMNAAISRKPVYLRLQGATVLQEVPLDSTLVAAQLSYLDLSCSLISKLVVAQLLSLSSSLTKLSLEHTEINTEIVASMDSFAHSIDTLNFTMCNGMEAEPLCNFFTKCKKLKRLNMGCIKQSWTDDNFSNIVNCLPTELEQLNLSGFRQVLSDPHVQLLVQRCENLLEVDLSDSPLLTFESVKAIAEFQKLKHLSLTRCYAIQACAYAYLVRLKSLRYLEIFSLFKEATIVALAMALPGVTINNNPFSSIARPSHASTPNTIWSERVRN